MFQVISSQSRYELQQELLLNPNGLKTNQSNRFGNVDALNNVSSLNSVSHPNFAESVNQGVLISQPNLVVDHFGAGKNAILFNGTSDYLIKTATTFTPDWDEEFWIAGKFKSGGSPNRVMIAIAEGAIALRGFRIQFDASNKILLNIVNELGAFKQIRSVSSYNDNLEHNYILHWAGTDNVNDSNLYVDEALETTTKTASGSFVGTSLYPSGVNINLYFGARQDINVNAFWNQYLGKHIYGLGEPNVEAIFNSLNSSI